MTVTLPAKCQDVGELLSTEHARGKEENQRCLLKILSSLRFLARQGCPFRGHNETDAESNDGNFYQLCKLRAEDDEKVTNFIPLHAFMAVISHVQLHSWLQ